MNLFFKNFLSRYLLIILILAGAFFVRQTYFTQAKKSKLLRHNLSLGTDMRGFHDWSIQIAKGDWLLRQKGVLFQPPAYPYFLGVVYGIFGQNYLKAAYVQSIIGVVLVFFIYHLTQKIFTSRPISCIAAGIAAFYPVSLYYELLLQRTSVVTFVYFIICYTVVFFNENPSKKKSFFIGLLCGGVILFEPQSLLFIPIISMYLFFYHKKNVAYPLTFCLGVLFVLLPVTLRNFYFGKFVLISSNGPVTWIAGNSYDSTGWFLEPKKGLIPVLSLDFFILLCKKIFLWFSAYEIPNNTNYYQFKEHIPILNYLPVSYGILVPLAALGIYLSYEYKKKLSFLYLFLGFYTAITVIFMSLSRFRFPIVPILIVFSGFTLHRFFYNLQIKKYTSCFAGIIVFFFLYVVFKVPSGFALVQPNYSANLGNVYYESKRYKDAAREYEKVLQDKTYYDPSIYLPLGNSYLKQGKIKKGVGSLIGYVNANPDAYPVAIQIASIYKSNGYNKEALAFYKRSLPHMLPNSAEYNKIVLTISNMEGSKEKRPMQK